MPAAFVTGGSGFVGAALIRRLVADGWSVRALARSADAEAAVRDAGRLRAHIAELARTTDG